MRKRTLNKSYLLSFAKIAQAPNKPWLLPLHEHGHVVAVVLWRKRATEHNVSTSEEIKENEKKKNVKVHKEQIRHELKHKVDTQGQRTCENHKLIPGNIKHQIIVGYGRTSMYEMI